MAQNLSPAGPARAVDGGQDAVHAVPRRGSSVVARPAPHSCLRLCVTVRMVTGGPGYCAVQRRQTLLAAHWYKVARLAIADRYASAKLRFSVYRILTRRPG